MSLKAAIIGCGKIAWEFQHDPGAARFGICTHAAAWSAIDGVRLAAVSDVDAARAGRCAARWQVAQAFSDAREMLRAVDPEIVSITSPDETHTETAALCLEHPSVRAVLVEKPLAASARDARELERKARESGKVVVVNYIRRFSPSYRRMRERISSGEFGDPRLTRGLYTKGMRHNGSHAIDLLNFFVPGTRLLRGRTPSWLRDADAAGADPPADIELALANGAVGILHSLPHQEHTVFELDLVFEKARLIFKDGGDIIEEHLMADGVPFAGYRSLVLAATHEHALKDYLLHAARHVLAVLDGSEENISDIGQSVLMLEQYEALQLTTPSRT